MKLRSRPIRGVLPYSMVNRSRSLTWKLRLVSLQIDNPKIRGMRHFAWHPNSKYLAIGPFATEGIELWDVDDGVRINTFYHDTGELRLRFDSTGERLLTYDAWGDSLLIWNISSGEIELSKVGIVMLAVFRRRDRRIPIVAKAGRWAVGRRRN